MNRITCYAAVSAFAAAACNGDGTGTSESDVTSKTTYLDIGDFVSSDADIERWLDIRLGLDREFDQICGDTFCGGDWSNLYSLGFTCSVSSKQGRMRECLWTFAASDERIDGATGAITSTVPFFECRSRPTGTVRNFLPAFGADLMDSTLPGLAGTLSESLTDCFDTPIGAETLPEPTEGPFADVADNLASEEIDAWYSMLSNLRQGFDDACGDSFCEGEYTNLQALRFRCSENTETGKLGTCAWMFAGSNVERTSKGFMEVDKAPFVCTFPVDATPAELAAALAPIEGDDPLRRPLPNGTTTLNDVLIDCL